MTTTDSPRPAEDLERVLAEIDAADVDPGRSGELLPMMQTTRHQRLILLHWPAIRAALVRERELREALREWSDERAILRAILESHAVTDGSREMLAQERIWKIELRLEALLAQSPADGART